LAAFAKVSKRELSNKIGEEFHTKHFEKECWICLALGGIIKNRNKITISIN
jgi:hypothetical protein